MAIAIAFAGAGPSAAADAQGTEVPVELWDRPRSGRIVIAVPAVRAALASLQAKPDSRLAIRHAPGPEPALQAEELKAWLVAHAIEPERIAVRADLPARQPLHLEVQP
jgi:hypothetical protein